ncbi:MAG: hypothetical protein JOZ48_23610 [Acidobacteriaceae bacterium]|nr:hypothetical protein [Acidobacteriaceae bacterium]
MRLFCILFLLLAARADDITPRVGVVEIYGARKVSIEKIKSAVGVKQGDSLPSREDVEDRIDKISGILASRVEAECCDQRNMILYVGVQEKDAAHFEFHPAPTGELALPAELAGNYHTFLDEVAASIRAHNADEDLTNGYSLMADPNCRKIQETFIGFADRDLSLIDRVLRESADSEQRAIAAYVLQYGPRGPRTSKTIVDALQYALQDQEDTVRENAMRALQAVAVGARLHPEQEIRIELTWFVELMNSVVWSDRHGASLALVNLTESRDPETLALIRDRALSSVIEMARWHDLEHALPPFLLAGRLAGLDENSIRQAWLAGDREAVLKQALNAKGKRGRDKNPG